MFVASGSVRDDATGRRRHVRWEGGVVTGDAMAVALLSAEATALEGRQIGPVGGPYTVTRHLRHELSAIAIARRVFADDAEITGDTAARPLIPTDAVG